MYKEISEDTVNEKNVLISFNRNIYGAKVLSINEDTYRIKEYDIDMNHKYNTTIEELKENFDVVRESDEQIKEKFNKNKKYTL